MEKVQNDRTLQEETTSFTENLGEIPPGASQTERNTRCKNLMDERTVKKKVKKPMLNRNYSQGENSSAVKMVDFSLARIS